MTGVPHPVTIGNARLDGSRLGIVAGPCSAEDPGLLRETAGELRRLTGERGLPFVFKSSYAKDNRSSVRSYRGPGLQEGLAWLEEIREGLGVPVISDVHTPEEVPRAAPRLDALQIPAFLCRQTSLLDAAGRSGKPVNIKKGQFVAPGDMARAVEKIRETGNDQVLVTERGATFGYHNLVVDMRSLVILAGTGCPVVYDATHSLQLPGGGEETGGDRAFALPLARAAVAAGAHVVFFETHPDPSRARSDAATQLPLAAIPGFLDDLVRVWRAREPETDPVS